MVWSSSLKTMQGTGDSGVARTSRTLSRRDLEQHKNSSTQAVEVK